MFLPLVLTQHHTGVVICFHHGVVWPAAEAEGLQKVFLGPLLRALKAGALLLPAMSPGDGIPAVKAGSCSAGLHWDEISTPVFLLSLALNSAILTLLRLCRLAHLWVPVYVQKCCICNKEMLLMWVNYIFRQSRKNKHLTPCEPILNVSQLLLVWRYFSSLTPALKLKAEHSETIHYI